MQNKNQMRTITAILTVLVMLFTLCAATAGADGDVGLQIISCPEQGFSTLCSADYSCTFNSRDGVTIYTEYEGSIPYVLVYCSEDWIAETAEYIHEQYTPYMQKQYGENLVSYEEYDHYSIGGRDMAAGIYTYRLQGYLIDMIRAYDVQNGPTVAFTAKYIRGQGEATLAALDEAVAYYRPWANYYSADFNSRWRYMTIGTTDGDLIFIFDEVFIAIPADWAGKYDIKVNDNSISFYHSLSRRMWNSREGFEGGLLFSLGYSETEDFRYLPSYDEIGTGANGYYYLIYPTDYQAYAEIPMIRSEYDAMWSEIDFVSQNSYSFIFHTDPVG